MRLYQLGCADRLDELLVFLTPVTLLGSGISGSLRSKIKVRGGEINWWAGGKVETGKVSKMNLVSRVKMKLTGASQRATRTRSLPPVTG